MDKKVLLTFQQMNTESHLLTRADNYPGPASTFSARRHYVFLQLNTLIAFSMSTTVVTIIQTVATAQ